jgi:Ca-activated chloride channel family protein
MGLMRFSTEITRLVPIAGMRRNRDELIAATRTILPDGDTRLRDAIAEGVAAVEKRLEKDAINAVVVLTDGKDTVSSRTTLATLDELERQGQKETGQIRVFTIAYGATPNKRELSRYAAATGGKSYAANTDDIATIYRSISSFF